MSSPSIKVVIPLAEAHTNKRTGGKAICLSRLIAGRFPVPRGFVLSADAYRSHLWASGVREIASAQADAEEREAIRAAILAQPISEDVWQSVAEAYERLSWQIGDAEPKVAVRSSALEDSQGGAGFPGAYESYLNVSGLENLGAAIKRVWGSLWSGKAAAYRARYGGSGEPAMGVIVQQMVESRCGGSAFTANPVTGDPRSVGVVMRAGEQSHQYSVSLRDFSVAGPDSPAECCEAEIKKIAEQAIPVEDAVGGRAEVEWALDRDELWIVQAGPIRELPRFFPAEADGDTTWVRADSAPITRMARGLASCDASTRIINGYLYSRGPHDEHSTKHLSLLERDWGKRSPAVRERALQAAVCDGGSLRAVAEDARTTYSWMRQAELSAEASVDSLAQVVGDRTLPWRLLGGVQDSVYERDVLLQELSERFSIAEKSGKLEEEKWWRGYRSDVEKFARQYGYSFRDAGDAADPSRWQSWTEDVDAVFRMIGAISRRGAKPTLVTLHSAAELDAKSAEDEVLAQLSNGKQANLKRLLESARSILCLRAETEQLHALSCAALRRHVLALANRLCEAGAIAAREDAFLLDIDELVGLVEQSPESVQAELRGKIAGRKHEGWLERRLSAPDALPLPEETVKPEQADSRLCGVVASQGTASGRARIVSAIEEASEIEDGDILVVSSPSAAWTPFLAIAGGLVCESGGEFSPCAILARTYGIPAVVDCKGATDAIRDGGRISVDGIGGLVGG